MSKDVSIKDGANLNLKGLASMDLEVAKKSLNYALNPDDFFGLIPRMLVKEGDKVSLGQPIFHDKSNESIKIASPVSGKIVEIVRGAKRKILNIIIKKEGDNVVNFKIPALSNIGKDKILELLVESCSLAFIRQRPYNIIARPDRLPKSIFVSIHSTAPYAADYTFILKNRMEEFQTGIDVMSRLIDKPINLSIPYNCESDFTNLKNVDIYKIKGSQREGRVSEEDVKSFIKESISGKSVKKQTIVSEQYDHSEFGEVTIKPIPRIKKITVLPRVLAKVQKRFTYL